MDENSSGSLVNQWPERATTYVVVQLKKVRKSGSEVGVRSCNHAKIIAGTGGQVLQSSKNNSNSTFPSLFR